MSESNDGGVFDGGTASNDGGALDAGSPSREADASTDAAPEGADAAPEGGIGCLLCGGVDSGDAAPADGSLDAP
jgi:hypothetical protein